VLEKAVELLEARLGREHPDTATAIGRLAMVHHMKGDVEEAKAAYRETIELIETAMGPDHIKLVDHLSNLGVLHRSVGELDQAISYYERAMKIREIKLGAGHPEIALLHVNIGNLLLDRDEVDQAKARFLLALEMFEKKLEADDPYLAYPISNLGHLAQERGDHVEAVRWLERAAAIRDTPNALPHDRADSRFYLAVSLWELGEDRQRAEALSSQALEDLAQAGPRFEPFEAGIHEWRREVGID